MVLINLKTQAAIIFVVFMVLFAIIILLLIYGEIAVVNYGVSRPGPDAPDDVMRHASQL
ncbi:hypothetical protein [Rahnella sp. PD4]|uniref:hypothetical protein n=1 Tax=Rahnella sp. PD4 TaxID=3368611 RepID=UPI003BA15DA8